MKNLTYCVSLVQNDLQDYSSNQYQRILQYAILGYRDLQLTTMPNIEVAYLTMNDALCAPLPKDYDFYTKVGVVIGGQIWTLTVNKDMAPNTTNDCGVEVAAPTSIPPGTITGQSIDDLWYFAPTYRNGQFVGELYATGGGFNELGYFRIDEQSQSIQFQSVVPKAPIIMEYVSSGTKNGGSTVVPAKAVAAIRAYIHWQLNEFDKTVSIGEKERLRQHYFDEFEKLKFINFCFTKDEYLDSTYENYKQTVKR